MAPISQVVVRIKRAVSLKYFGQWLAQIKPYLKRSHHCRDALLSALKLLDLSGPQFSPLESRRDHFLP